MSLSRRNWQYEFGEMKLVGRVWRDESAGRVWRDETGRTSLER